PRDARNEFLAHIAKRTPTGRWKRLRSSASAEQCGVQPSLTHLRGSQPEKVAHVTAPFLGRESRRETEINAS
ncbi:hypothetical protein, partial [Paracoccus nototheniae]